MITCNKFTQLFDTIVNSKETLITIQSDTELFEYIMENTDVDDDNNFFYNVFTPDDDMNLETTKQRFIDTILYCCIQS